MEPDPHATPDRAAEVYVVVVGYDVEDVRVFSTLRAAVRFQNEDSANHSAPFACVIEESA